ncbi:nucleocapsid protein [Hemipteran phasma-related virus OKIAV247]|uniref:Nucleocapsid protein n=1 Tax=Hemipteran phasma-related virus OKIAV247 TaxID=2746303 RepID=A0A7D7JFL0_9VIRU|nr:nucleocapsid protein [Hemipteran phasma-related virus OKIAV247]QMP82172.1 nucleocapsid protein [Hemipteran phasma-related virus OKIAV247]
MSSIKKLAAKDFREVNVNIEQAWPAAMLKAAGETAVSDKAAVYELIFKKFDDSADARRMDKSLKVRIDQPTSAMAFATYCTSSLWSQNVRDSRGLNVFNIKLGEVTIPIYSTKGEANMNYQLPENVITVDDAIHCSTIYLNRIVEDYYLKKEGTWAMTPLARICMTDNNIVALADEMNLEPATIVKTLNISACRKAHQLYQLTEYCSLEMAVACIMRTSFSKNASPTTRSIATKNVSKCVNKAGVGGINTNKVATMLSYMVSNSGLELDTDSLMDMAKRLATNRVPIMAKSGRTTTGFKDEEEGAVGGAEVGH